MKKRNFLVVNNQPTNEYYRLQKYDRLNNKYNSSMNQNQINNTYNTSNKQKG